VADSALCRAALDELLHILVRRLAQGDGFGLSAAIAVGAGLVSYYDVALALASLTKIHLYAQDIMGIYSLGKIRRF
jgi:hypothetical protein